MTGLALSTGSGLGGVLITGVNSAVSPLVLGCNLLVGFLVAAAGVVLTDVLADVLTGSLLAFLVGVLVVLVVFVVVVVFVVGFVGVVLVVLGLVTVVEAVASKDKDKFNETIAIVNADRVSTRDSGCG